MHGLCRVIGAGIPYRFCGRTRLLHPMRLSDWGVCEQYLLEHRLDAFEFAIQSRLSIGSEIRAALRETGKRRNYLSYEDVNEFTDTPTGIALTAWLCFRGAFEFEECEEWVEHHPREHSRFCRTRDQISGVNVMANLDWPISMEKDDTKTNWLTCLRGMCELMGVPPTEIAELTFYQLMMLTRKVKELSGIVSIPPEELANYRKRSDAALI